MAEKEAVPQKTIEEMSIDELKALAYDQVVLLQQTQNNINLLQAEIQKRK
jgi:hypothetical protein